MNVLVLDCDGVVVHPKNGRRWDQDLTRDLGIKPETLQSQFFQPNWRKIVCGEADLYETLERVWPDLCAQVTVRDLVEYWFARDAGMNEEVLSAVDAWRARGGKAYLGTVQEHHRAKYLWNELGLSRRFDDIYYSAALGVCKPDEPFYAEVHRRLPVRDPRDVIFFDDAVRNVEAARAFGWQAHHFTKADDLRAVLTSASPTG